MFCRDSFTGSRFIDLNGSNWKLIVPAEWQAFNCFCLCSISTEHRARPIFERFCSSLGPNQMRMDAFMAPRVNSVGLGHYAVS
jgi:hypothetical protein